MHDRIERKAFRKVYALLICIVQHEREDEGKKKLRKKRKETREKGEKERIYSRLEMGKEALTSRKKKIIKSSR